MHLLEASHRSSVSGDTKDGSDVEKRTPRQHRHTRSSSSPDIHDGIPPLIDVTSDDELSDSDAAADLPAKRVRKAWKGTRAQPYKHVMHRLVPRCVAMM